ncbi:hypothetical protein BBJ28_00021443 [Nothophytophthora sp. Chile5]|nr:hypothetical protein BBJ28_00021443 [Nothophytophthora sp. Chile5]
MRCSLLHSGPNAALLRTDEQVIYYEKFFQRMGPNLPGGSCSSRAFRPRKRDITAGNDGVYCILWLPGVVDTAKLLFQRCYEYRDEIRDELEYACRPFSSLSTFRVGIYLWFRGYTRVYTCRSSVAYVADAGRWVVGMGDWNSKMEKRLVQINELVLLANSLLTEFAVTGHVGAEGCREELDAYLQILASTITLKNADSTNKSSRMLTDQRSAGASNGNGRTPASRSESNSFAEFSSEISGAISEIFGSKDLTRSASSGTVGQSTRSRSAGRATDSDNDAMNPFAESYRRPVDRYTGGSRTLGSSGSSSVQSLSDTGAGGRTTPTLGTDTDYSLSNGDSPEGPMSPVSMGEYECLEVESIPKYAAFKSSAQLAARTQRVANGNGSLTTSVVSDGGRSVWSDSSTETHELFPLPPSSAQTVSKSLSSLETTAIKQKPAKPVMDMNYSYDFQCEEAHNPFLSPSTASSMMTSLSAPATIQELPMPPQLNEPEHLELNGPECLELRELPVVASTSEEGTRQVHESTVDAETEALAAALAASIADQSHQDNDHHEYDLFGCGKQ